MSGCGSSDNTELTGTVTNEDGTPVANARVVLMNRITDEKYSTLSNSDGLYTVSLPNGHYDLGADNSAGEEVTIIGPVSVQGNAEVRNISLPTNESDNTVMGTLYITDNVPAANYRLHLTSNVSRTKSDVTHESLSVDVTTDANGMFRATVVGQHHFDMDIYDPNGQFIEFVDLHKMEGALNTIITLGTSEDNNLKRHNQASASANSAGVAKTTAAGCNTPFTITGNSSTGDYVAQGGCLGVNGGYATTTNPAHYAGEYMSPGLFIQPLSSNSMSLIVQSNGTWFFDNRITIQNTLTLLIFNFEDATGDTYTLTCDYKGTHEVSYNSDDPSIKRIAQSDNGNDVAQFWVTVFR
jgi:hypothetical protein